jgi:CheY-like chemotaxis protein
MPPGDLQRLEEDNEELRRRLAAAERRLAEGATADRDRWVAELTRIVPGVLYVFDLVERRNLAALLALEGHRVGTAHDGRGAVDAALAQRPDVVLLDIGLPGLDGYGVCRALRAAGLVDTLVVAITGYGQDDDRRASEAAGFDAHLVKPVDPQTLVALLAEATAA